MALTREEIMHMKRMGIRRLVAVGFVIISVMSFGVNGVAQAIPVTFSFQGQIQFVGSVLNPPILPNTPVSGTYAFEHNAVDLFPGDLSRGRYSLSALTFNLLGNSYSTGTKGLRVIEVFTGTGLSDRYSLVSQNFVGPSINGLAPITLTLEIPGINAFSNDSLPLTPPPLGSLLGGNVVGISFANPTLTFGTTVSGPLTALTAVPETSSLMLMGLGLLGLIGFEMRRGRATNLRRGRATNLQ